MRLAALLVALPFAVALGGCAAATPFEYRAADRIPEGPGLFSGPDGAFTLHAAGWRIEELKER